MLSWKNLKKMGADIVDKIDYKAINWINSNLNKIEPILEAGERIQRRPGQFTGIPTLVGRAIRYQQSGRERLMKETMTRLFTGQMMLQPRLKR